MLKDLQSNQNINHKKYFSYACETKLLGGKLTLGVSICLDVISICLDVISIEISISTSSKSESRWSRYLDFVSTTMSRPKSLDRDREIVEIWNFWHFSTVCLDLDREVQGFLYFLVEISQSVETLGLNNVEISRQILTISTCLDNLDKNLNASQSRLKNLNFKNLDREKKKLISTVEKISTI